MDMNQHRFAMFVDVHDAPTAVIGAGPVALRKAQRLLDAGATVNVIAPKACDGFHSLADTQKITLHLREFQEADVQGMTVVIAATNSLDINHQIATLAKAAGAQVNVANDPAAGSFIMPSLVDRTPLLIAISSGGASPVLSRLLTARIEAFIPARFAQLATLAGNYRKQIKTKLDNWRDRRRFWEQQLGGRVGELVLQGRAEEAENALQHEIDQYKTRGIQGEVYLVGAGPGDPDLLSFRALRLMQHVDVVFHDRLVAPAILDMVKPSATRIYVGKKRSDHAMQQETINEQLVKHAKLGKRVLRLKGGDPFIFGRGGEEIEELVEHGIAFQVVPGVTAAAGCASYAGIPLTHRDHSQACMFVTGHLKDNTVNLNWEALSHPNQTVVIYMGLVGLPHIVSNLIKHGMPSSTPIALISQGTTPQQVVVVGTLDSIVEQLEKQPVKAPTLTIIGDVVTLREKLDWFTPNAHS